MNLDQIRLINFLSVADIQYARRRFETLLSLDLMDVNQVVVRMNEMV